jgi:hypothetical protein
MLDCIEKRNCLCCRVQIAIKNALSALLAHFLRPQAFPRADLGDNTSLPLLEMYKILPKSGRSASGQPGQFRRSQDWIGGTRPGNALCVPASRHRLDGCLSASERFLRDPTSRGGARALGEHWRADRLA